MALPLKMRWWGGTVSGPISQKETYRGRLWGGSLGPYPKWPKAESESALETKELHACFSTEKRNRKGTTSLGTTTAACCKDQVPWKDD